MTKNTNKYSIHGKVNIFPGHGGWTHVLVPKSQTEKFTTKGRWGYIPIYAAIGETKWETSLLPMGDGSYFIALNAQVRKKEHISIGDVVTVVYTLR